jgi:hypothetical protein
VSYLLNILIALSQLGNTILGGYPDESMSARAWRSREAFPGRITRPLIDALFFVITLGNDRNHCETAYESERIKRQFPDHYRA